MAAEKQLRVWLYSHHALIVYLFEQNCVRSLKQFQNAVKIYKVFLLDVGCQLCKSSTWRS
jgi:hypothetical protein